MKSTNVHGIIIFLCLLAGASLGILAGCKKNSPVEPPGIDSTSHAVIWRTDTIGHGGAFKDIAIIDEDNIWAVGEFSLRDSTGQLEPEFYNVMQWDGTKWRARRLYFTVQGTKLLSPGDAVLAFGANDIWLACNAPRHWDGQSLTSVDPGGLLYAGGVTALWGSSSSNYYVVGVQGTFDHFDGQRFTRIPTGIQSWFCDVTGSGNQLYVASYAYDNQIYPSGIFSYANGRFTFVAPDTADHSRFATLQNAFGIWLSPQGHLWAVGQADVFQPLSSHAPLYTNDYILKGIRGTADNDVWAAGDRSSIVHYNGSTWRKYSPPELGTSGIGYVLYNKVAVRGNTIVAGGWAMSPDCAVLTLGKRIP